jgi:tetratricopeptide (TPR) repeat protein
LPGAVEHFRTAIRIRPEYVEAQHNLGAALLESGQWNEALTELQLALRMNPIAKTHFAAARALTELGRIEEAVAHYGEALRLKPDYADALNNRANLRLQGGDAASHARTWTAQPTMSSAGERVETSMR